MIEHREFPNTVYSHDESMAIDPELVHGSSKDFGEQIDIKSIFLRQLFDNNRMLGASIVAVSRQIHDESIALLYAHNEFRFEKWLCFHCFLTISGTDNTKHLRHVQLPFPFPKEYFIAHGLLTPWSGVPMHTYNVIWATDALQTFKSLPNLQKLTVFADLDTYRGYYKATNGELKLVLCDLDQIPEHCDVDIHGELVGRIDCCFTDTDREPRFRRPYLDPYLRQIWTDRGYRMTGIWWRPGDWSGWLMWEEWSQRLKEDEEARTLREAGTKTGCEGEAMQLASSSPVSLPIHSTSV